MSLQGNKAIGLFEKRVVFDVELENGVPSHGFAGYGTATFGLADFDNLLIEDTKPFVEIIAQ